MAFLTLNGWQVPARIGSVRESHEYPGEIGDRWDNQPSRNRKAITRKWSGDIFVQEEQDADCLEALLSGRGHHFDFRDGHAWSFDGLGPEAGGTYSVGQAGALFDRWVLTVTGSITWNPGLGDFWTVLYWRNAEVASSEDHIAVRSDGAKWLDGVRADATVTTELTVSAGAVALDSTQSDYADIVILPFLASDSYIQDFYTWTAAGNRHGDAPRISLGGDMVGEEIATVPRPPPSRYIQGGPKSGAPFANNMRGTRLELSEVAQRQICRPAPMSFQVTLDDVDRLNATPTPDEFVASWGREFGDVALNADGITYADGPWGFERAGDIGNATTSIPEIPQAFAEAIIGTRQLSFWAWVWRDANTDVDTVFSIHNGTNTLAFMSVEVGGGVRVGGRSTSADSVKEATSAFTVTAGEWALVGGWIDLAREQVGIALNEGDYSEAAITSLGAAEFEGTPPAVSGYIGANITPADPWNGLIHSVAWALNRRLSAADFSRIYRAGRQGNFR